MAYIEQNLPDRESRISAFANAAEDMEMGAVQLVVIATTLKNECDIDIETALKTVEAEMKQDIVDGGTLKKFSPDIIDGSLNRAKACLGLPFKLGC